MMAGAIQTALAGLRAHVESFDQTASRIARNAPLGDLPGGMVQLMRDERGVEVNARVARAADELTGILLDLFV